MYQTTTRIFHIRPEAIDPVVIQQAAKVLRSGGLVAFPTETVYGLGADALNAAAVERIFSAKERPSSDPLIVHIAEVAQLSGITASVPKLAWRLAEAFWPGPLTLILKRGGRVPDAVSAGLDTVAVRLPANTIAQALITTAGTPVAAPSANRFTRPSPTTAQHVLDDLGGRVDIILDGGPCTIGLESTVLDLISDPPVVLRPGGLPVEVLQRIDPRILVRPRYITNASDQVASSPGMLLRHYSPTARLLVVTGEPAAVLKQIVSKAKELLDAGKKVGVMVSDEDMLQLETLSLEVVSLGSRDNLDQIGANLFAAMRALDQAGVDVILASDFSREGLGLAIRDRLIRAADGKLIEA